MLSCSLSLKYDKGATPNVVVRQDREIYVQPESGYREISDIVADILGNYQQPL
jgi:hypothetical protein